MRKHHFDNKGRLPQHVGKGAARREAPLERRDAADEEEAPFA
jgi:hypothetical protein